MAATPEQNEIREIKNLQEMRDFAVEAAAWLVKEERLLLLLDGEMGAGKTQFTRFLLEAQGSAETASPSFAIHNSYETARGEVDHIDLYRLESEADLESTGFWDLFLRKKGLVIIEWAERLKEFGLLEQLPRTWPKLAIHFSIPEVATEKRQLKIQKFF